MQLLLPLVLLPKQQTLQLLQLPCQALHAGCQKLHVSRRHSHMRPLRLLVLLLHWLLMGKQVSWHWRRCCLLLLSLLLVLWGCCRRCLRSLLGSRKGACLLLLWQRLLRLLRLQLWQWRQQLLPLLLLRLLLLELPLRLAVLLPLRLRLLLLRLLLPQLLQVEQRRRSLALKLLQRGREGRQGARLPARGSDVVSPLCQLSLDAGQQLPLDGLQKRGSGPVIYLWVLVDPY